MTDEPRASRAAAEIARINAFFPIMPMLGNRWAASRPFENLTVGISAHITTLTGALVRELSLGGGSWVLCAASGATTDHAVVALLRDSGIEVYTTGSREDYQQQVLDHHPQLLVDVGANLIGTLIQRRPGQVSEIMGAVEVTKSGVDRIAALPSVDFPIININDGRLKYAIENRRGVGEGLWHAVQALTGMHLSGRRVGVIGYGPVGQGVATFAKALGAVVEVVEVDAIRRLVARYDGYQTPSLEECLGRAGMVVTCTGRSRIVTAEMLQKSREGLVLINAGHGGDEIDIPNIKASAVAVDQVADHVIRYRLEDGPTVVALGDGHPLNIVINAGSPEPVLLHFALMGLTLEWLTLQSEMAPGMRIVDPVIEQKAAELALEAHNVGHG
ncbi:MAG: NAD(P)-dependent oxidoreductase [Myxococcota bacterium]